MAATTQVRLLVWTFLEMQVLKLHHGLLPGQFKGSPVPGTRECYQGTRVTGYQDTKVPGLQSSRAPTRVPGYKGTRVPGTRVPGNQTRVCHQAGYQGSRVPGHHSNFVPLPQGTKDHVMLLGYQVPGYIEEP